MMELFLSLVLAHLVADFMLQTGKSCKDKKERHWKSPHHYIHALIVFGLSWLVSWDVCFWWGALMIGVAHLGIDIWKSYREDNVVWFTLDQVMHLLVIAGVAYAWTGCHDWSFPFGIELRHVVIAVALLICWKPANFFIKLMLKHYSVNIPKEKETAKTEYVLAGTLLSILIAVLAGMMVIGVLKP